MKENKKYDFHVGNLSGKRLLVLGCKNNADDIRYFAVEENVVIVAAGKKISNEILSIASEHYIIDFLDRQQLKDLIKDKNIDGVFVGGDEPLISVVIDVAGELNLPFYSSRELWDRLMNKQSFKDTCRAFDVPTPGDFKVREDHFDEDAAKLQFPIVIKPVDSCGANGVMKCDSLEEFKDLYEFSKSKSKSGKVTMESFIDGDSIGAYYTFVDGKVSLSSMHDKYVRMVPGTFIPLSEIYAYPSKHLQQYKRDMDSKVRSMLTGLGIKNGIANCQGFYDHGTFKFIEIGYRLGGTAQYHYTQEVNNFSSFYMMMAHALTGKMQGCPQERDNADFSKPCCTLSLLSKGGKIARIEGVSEIEKIKEIIHYEERYKVGDTIPVTRTVAQFHYRFFIVTDTVSRMKEIINIIQDTVKAYDENGESMLVTHFDTNKLDFGDNEFITQEQKN